MPFIDFMKRARKRLRSAFSKALFIFRGAINAHGLTSLEFHECNLPKKSGLRETERQGLG